MVSPALAEELTFGVYTSDKPTVMYKKFYPIIKHLEQYMKEKNLPVTISMKIFASYSGAIDAIVEGEIDFARFGPASYILAHDRNNGIRLLCMEQKNGRKQFKGVFITRNDTHPITSLKDIQGKSFAFGDQNSTIGRYLAQAELVKNDISSTDLKSFSYLGRHDKVALAVAAGNYDAGVVKENTFKKYAKSKGLKKIAEFPNVTKPWVIRAGYDEEIFKGLQQGMLELQDKSILKSLKQDGFVIATDQEYDFVRQGMKLSKQF
ncbi:MAG: phosphate/phosphite/phosphonate ABC transporter substrate-binding protein [Desulfobulbaceae bacterium]|nr:phosphate/phosphite/phosphonate ABC transporter substrate-binding protein [Desulfobulbaceae bacterium]